MKLMGDYHTHTVYSRLKHGKGTILENALSAKAKGLEEIAITDHGFSHLFYGVKRKNLAKIRQEIEEAKEITGINILLGVEANIISVDGTLDITEEDYEKLDILVVGYHKLVKFRSLKDFFSLFFPNLKKKTLEKQKEINTKALLGAMEKYPIDILSHLNYGFKVDVGAIAKMANQKNIKIELNGKKICFDEKEIEILKNEKVEFILNSDAHSPKRVGDFKLGQNFLIKNDIEEKYVCNLDKFPNFNRVD